MRYLAFCLLLLVTHAAHCQADTDNAVINTFSDTTIKDKRAFKNNGGYYLVKIYSRVNDAFKKNYHTLVLRKFNNGWYVIHANNMEALALNDAGFQYFLPANDNWKLSPSLIIKKNKLSLKNEFDYLIKVNNITAFQSFISQHTTAIKLKKLNEDARLFLIHTSMQFMLGYILPLEVVSGIDIRDIPPKPETVVVDYNSDVNNINVLQAAFPAIRGDSLTVSIKENLFDTTDIDLIGRIKPTTLSSSSVDVHATTMATLIGGAGNSFFRGKGVAPGALLSSSDFTVLMPDADAAYKQYNISVQNHSYGVNIEEFYGNDAAAYDSGMLSNPSLLHIFSAGNAGGTASSDGQYTGITGFANITGSFKMSKSSITVGAVDTFYHVMSFSSAGPAYDGRVKPELVAYGNAGTSNAAAITSGTALVMQDAYRKLHNNNLPANALVKAILLNSADDVGQPGIDFISGYGNVNAYRAVHDIQYGKFFGDSVKQGETKDFFISIPSNAKDVKIMLVWNDVPAQAFSPVALVNDLDLSLQNATTKQTWLPWVLNSYANADSLLQLPTRKRDSLNTAEQVTLDAPEQGDYIIHVKGYDVTEGPQPFYIACRWDTANTFTFTYWLVCFLCLFSMVKLLIAIKPKHFFCNDIYYTLNLH